MPELPEVETVCRGLEPLVRGRAIRAVMVREPRLRWRIPEDLAEFLEGQTIESVGRRGKYLLVHLSAGTLLIHLGMSGRLQALTRNIAPSRHDHVDIFLSSGLLLRFHDPRRFGCLLPVYAEDPLHPLLARLGPEPFDLAFSGEYLYSRSRSRKTPVKAFLMDGGIVAGVGNIYASEALYGAGLHPATKAGRIGRARYRRLAQSVQQTLLRAIDLGGSTLRDFTGAHGEAGYFQQVFTVYGRNGKPCYRCGSLIQRQFIAQRSSFFCPNCQS